MLKIILHGCNGQMGRVICQLADQDNDCAIAAGIDVNPDTGTATFPRYERLQDCDMPADVAVDFSTASAVDGLLDYCLQKRLPVVVCTTGLSEATKERIIEASKVIPVFQSANMSLGINLIARLVEKAAPLLADAGFDIEIFERHHNKKIDAPSGTAILLAEAAKRGLNDDKYHFVTDRSGVRQKRKPEEIGIQSLRGGTIVGEHELIFAGKDEVIEFVHKAYSKDVFATGAFKAARYLKDKPPGLYSMKDLMSDQLF